MQLSRSAICGTFYCEANGDMPTCLGSLAAVESKFRINCCSQCLVDLSSWRQLLKVESLNWSGRHWRRASRALKPPKALESSPIQTPGKSTVDYRIVASNTWQHASTIAPMDPWPEKAPFCPKTHWVNKKRGNPCTSTHQDHCHVTKSIIGLANIRQSAFVQKNLL